jgi:hypothetical protein
MDANAPLGTMANPQVTRNTHLYNYSPTYDMPENVIADFFGYVFSTISNPAAVTGASQQQVIIQDDSDFELRRLVYHYTRADAAFTNTTRPVPNWTIQITDSGSGRTLFNNPVPLDVIAFPSDSPPIDLPWPKIFRRNSTVQINIVNFDAAEATGILRFVMLGRKLFTLG